jgi:predicted nucleotidyltransferase
MLVFGDTVTLTPTLLGIAAFLSATTGVATTFLAIRKSHNESDKEMVANLRAAREHEEQLAAQLHKVKMAHPELVEELEPEEEAPEKEGQDAG